MSRSIFVAGILLILAVVPRNTNSAERDELLTQEDISLEVSERDGTPALNAPLDAPEYWESFNQWMCFETSSSELLKIGLTDGKIGTLEVPIISVSTLGHDFEISILGESQGTNDTIYNSWKELLENSSHFCAYAAYLNDLDSDHRIARSTWIITKLKTANGYWTYGEHR